MKRLISAFGAGILFLTIIICVFLYFAAEGRFEPEFVSAVVTSMLVLVTAVSVFLTVLLLRENRIAREREVEPAFNISLESVFAGGSNFVIENIGNGPGQNIEAILTLEPQGNKLIEIERKNMRPDDTVLELAPTEEPTVSIDEGETVKLEGTCENIFGKEVDIYDESKIDTLRRGSMDDLLRDESDRLERNLKKIEKSIESLGDEIVLDEFDLFIRRENGEVILDCLETHGGLTIRELSKQIGVPAFKLFSTIDWLENAGSIERDGDWEPDTMIKLQN